VQGSTRPTAPGPSAARWKPSDDAPGRTGRASGRSPRRFPPIWPVRIAPSSAEASAPRSHVSGPSPEQFTMPGVSSHRPGLPTGYDHSRKYLGATFVPTDTTWNHFEHFRRVFLRHGRPQALYTDGLALFGYPSSSDGGDPCSEFQRALTALGISHLVAPSPAAKGKIERRFGTSQDRLLALLASEQITRYDAAQVVLDHEVERQNRTICRTTGLSPDDAWNKAREEGRDVMRPAPPDRDHRPSSQSPVLGRLRSAKTPGKPLVRRARQVLPLTSLLLFPQRVSF